MKRIMRTILRAITTLLAWAAGGVALSKYGYFQSIGEIDNVIGMLPVVLVLVGACSVTVLIWMRHTKRFLPVTAAVMLLAVLAVVLFPRALRGNWWLNMKNSEGVEAKPDLSVYVPFSPASKTAKLSEKSKLTLTDDLPVLDGATALYPVYAAFAEAVYEQDSFAADDVLCTNTRGAYEAVMKGERDIIFVAGASQKQIAAAKDAGSDLHFTPIGQEAFVFLVGKDNPVDSISDQQIRNVYTGKTANWKTLGWPAGGKIIAFQRPEGSGSQTGLQSVMGELPIQFPQPLPSASLIGTNSLLKQVSVEWNGVQPALGYSYRYYATVMYANPDAKLLKINQVEPSVENIRDGSYPFVSSFYAVTNGEPKGNSKVLIDWILSSQGQEIVEKTGYIPIR